MQNKALRPYLRQSSEYLMDTTGSTAPEPQSSTSVGATLTSYNITEVSFDRLSVGTIDATGTISAGGFVTGASPDPRIEITASLIAGYSDATTKQFYLSATDGKAYFAGGLSYFDSVAQHFNRTATTQASHILFEYGDTSYGTVYGSGPLSNIYTIGLSCNPSAASAKAYSVLNSTSSDANAYVRCEALDNTPGLDQARVEIKANDGTVPYAARLAVTTFNGTQEVEITDSTDLNIYSDFGTTLKASIDGATGDITTEGTVYVKGDNGGVASTIGFTDISDTAARSTGVGTILFDDATNRNSAGFIKVYIGTTAYYIPIFAAI